MHCTTRHRCRPLHALAALACLSVPARAEPPQPDAAPIDVVITAPLATPATEAARVPATVRLLRRDDIVRDGTASALRALDERIGGVSLSQALGNEFQPSLSYRGFEASPLAGNAQGLAVYVNGTRFNQAFGDTTNWDLIPDVAIDRIDLSANNPAFGLNALGGAVSVQLRDGFTYHGTQLELSGGSFGRIRAAGQYGKQSGNVAAYIATTGLNEDGWRDHSPSQLRQLYADVGWKNDRTEAHINLTGAINRLAGNGPAPVDLLAARRSAVFTYPDQTDNKYVRVGLSLRTDLNDRTSLQAAAYYSRFDQRTANGNAADVEPCDTNRTVMCINDGPGLTTAGGAAIPNFLTSGLFPAVRKFRRGGPYAQLDETTTGTDGFGASLQATHQTEVAGRQNRLVVGASVDGGRTAFSARSSLGILTADRGYAGPGIVIDQADGSITPVRLSAASTYYGLHAANAFDITPALTLTASARLNVARIDLTDRIGTALNGNHSYARLNPALGLSYQIGPSLSAYAGYAENNRTPTPAELSCASPDSPCSLTNFVVADPPLKQVVARSIEAGLRGRFALDGLRVTWNAGVFRTDSDDDILYTASDSQGRGYFRNVGGTRRQGVEAGTSVRFGRFSGFLDYAVTDATFRSAFSIGAGNNPAAGNADTIAVRSGSRIPGIPAQQLKLGARVELTDNWSATLTGIISSGRVLQGDESNQNARTAAFTVLNLASAWQVADGIELFGSIRNLTDARYSTFGAFSPVNLVPMTESPGATNTRSLSPAAPRAAYGGVRVSF